MVFPYMSTLQAVKANDLKALKEMVDFGFKVDFNCIRVATYYGHLECLKYLHSIGLDLNAYEWKYEEKEGKPPVLTKHHLYQAATFGHTECVEYLLQNGVNDCGCGKGTRCVLKDV